MKRISSGAPALDGLTDVTITAVADDELLAYDSGTSEWINQTPAEAGVAPATTVDTQANILALTPTSGLLAYASDKNFFYVADGSNWYETQIKLNLRPQAPEMGSGIDSGQGYQETYITNKKLYNVQLQGHDATPGNGSIRIDTTNDPDTFEVYLRDAWQNLIYDLTTSDGDFRHTPLSEAIYVWRGDSVALGNNDRPMITEYESGMGSHPRPRVLNFNH